MSLAEFKNAWNISDPQFSSIGSIAPPETLHHGSEPQRSRFLELERTSKRQQFELEKAAAQIRSLKDDKATLERQIQEIQYDPFSSLSLNAELQKKLAMQRVEISRLVATNDTLKTEFYKGRVRITELEALAQTRKEKVNEVEGERLKLAQALLSTQSKLAEVGLVVAEKEAELEVIKQKLAASDESKVNGSCSNCTMTGSLQESLTQQGRRLAEREAELERLKASLEREVHASIQKSNQVLFLSSQVIVKLMLFARSPERGPQTWRLNRPFTTLKLNWN